MGDLLLELLGMVLEPILEAIFGYVAAAVADLFLRSLGKVFDEPTVKHPVGARIGYACLGLASGLISLALAPHRLVRPSRIPGISLLISPIITGLMLSATGTILRWRDKQLTQLEDFGNGFAFAFGMALMRFLFVR